MTDPTSVSGNLLWTPDGSPTEMESYASFVKAEKGFDWAGDYPVSYTHLTLPTM